MLALKRRYILNYLNLKKYLGNFVQNYKVYSKEVLVTEISGIISDEFSRRYDDLYLGVSFWTQGIILVYLNSYS